MFKKGIKWIFSFLGFEIRRKLSENEKKEIEYRQLLNDNKWLTECKFKTIIDIGANEGQFAHKMRRLFPDAKIISFEPLPHVYEILRQSFRNDGKFTSYNLALGIKPGKTQMWLNEFNPASSLLKIKEHLKHFGFARHEKAVEINIVQLDKILNVSLIEKPFLVKIDVQGYEENVIKGGMNILLNADMIISEVSFIQLYEYQGLFDRIYSLLANLGFNYSGNYDQLRSPVDNQILQADAIFVKNKK